MPALFLSRLVFLLYWSQSWICKSHIQKRASISLAIREMQKKTTVSYHLISTRLVDIKILTISSIGNAMK